MVIIKVKNFTSEQSVNYCKKNNCCSNCKLNFNKKTMNFCIVKNSHEQMRLLLNKYEYEKYMDKEIKLNEKML